MGNVSDHVQHQLIDFKNADIEEVERSIQIQFKPVVKDKNVVFIVDPKFCQRDRCNPFMLIKETLNEYKNSSVLIEKIEISHIRNDFDRKMEMKLTDIFDALEIDGKLEVLCPSVIHLHCPPSFNDMPKKKERIIYDISNYIDTNYIKLHAGQEEIMLSDSSMVLNHIEPTNMLLFVENHPLVLFINRFETDLGKNSENFIQISAGDDKILYKISKDLVETARKLYSEVVQKNCVYTKFLDTGLHCIQTNDTKIHLNKHYLDKCRKSNNFPPILSITFKLNYLIVFPGKLGGIQIKERNLNQNSNQNQ